MAKPRPQTAQSLPERKEIGRDALLTGLLMIGAAVVTGVGSGLLSGRGGLRVGSVGLAFMGLVCAAFGAVQWATGRGGFFRKLGGGFGTFVPLLVLATIVLTLLPWLIDRVL